MIAKLELHLMRVYRTSAGFERLVITCSLISLFAYILYLGLRVLTDIPVLAYYPIGIDFAVFWSAGKLALAGAARDAYSIDAISPIIMAITNADTTVMPLPWSYPPVAFFWFIPFAMLPYTASVVLWEGIGIIFYLYGLNKYSTSRIFLISMLGFPGFWMNLLWGNNTYILTALIALGYYNLQRKPFITGVMFGLLCYKIHLGALCILTLFLARAWKAVIGAAVTVLFLVISAVMYFPNGTWSAYLTNIPHAVDFLLISGWTNYPEVHATVYAFVRLLGVSSQMAFIIQGISALIVVSLIWRHWNDLSNNSLKFALVIPAIILATPYALQYDLALLGLPLVIYYEDVLKHGWLFWYERMMLFLCWLLPLYNWPIAEYTSIQLTPIILALFLLGIIQRIRVLKLRQVSQHQGRSPI